MARTAIIVGARGQDGRLLEMYLHSLGYRLACIDKGTVHSQNLAWDIPTDITSADEVFRMVRELQPDEIYHLAAIHQSAEGTSQNDLVFFRNSYEVNLFSLVNFLEGVRLFSQHTRLFYAASSHIFPPSPELGPVEVQNENAPMSPDSVYAMTKVDGLLAC